MGISLRCIIPKCVEKNSKAYISHWNVLYIGHFILMQKCHFLILKFILLARHNMQRQNKPFGLWHDQNTALFVGEYQPMAWVGGGVMTYCSIDSKAQIGSTVLSLTAPSPIFVSLFMRIFMVPLAKLWT